MRVALVHDWLTGLRGGERTLEELTQLFPDAEVFTLFYVPGSTSARIEALRIHASPLNRIPGAGRHYRKLLPLYPWAVSRLRPRGFDLVLSTSHAVAKAVPTAPGTPHLCYCFTPMRYVWDQAEAYLGRGLRRRLAAPLVRRLQRFDRRTSTPERVTRFVAISETVARRIQRHYGRHARVVPPPVDVDRIRPQPGAAEDFYLLVGGFVPYKREELAVEAFRGLERRLVVAGDGPRRHLVERSAPANVEFRGRVSDAELTRLYRSCRALVYPQEEDFGIVAVEAQAAGRPVIAFGRGGASETVVPLDRSDAAAAAPTGVWFDEPTPDALRAALRRFEEAEDRFDPRAIRRHAERYGPQRFREAMRREVDSLLAASPAPDPPESRPAAAQIDAGSGGG